MPTGFDISLSACLLLAWLSGAAAAQTPPPEAPFSQQIVNADDVGDGREHPFTVRPEVFVQLRAAGGAIQGRTDIEQGVEVTRLETRWAGQLLPRLGAAVELQWQVALDKEFEELVNDAYLEWYASRALTVRVGQFVKPFGFDIQQSSSVRESPERGMFAGYFFPSQRDRGASLEWTTAHAPVLGHSKFSAAVLTGNRLFRDNDGRLDLVLRARRFLAGTRGAVGISAQTGSQVVPPQFSGATRVRLIGLDGQYSWSRLGARVEWVHGTRPSTRYSPETVFTDAFLPHTTTSGLAVALVANASPRDQAYIRLDHIDGDPETGGRIRAWNAGYRRRVTDAVYLSADVQHKNAASSNDDAVNTRAQATLSVTF